ALRLIGRIMPLVWRQYPAAHVWIVGHSPDDTLLSKHDGKRVFVTGQVADVRPFLAAASVSCVPLLAGSGTKIKMLEALAAGLPVVATPLAAEGLELTDGRHLLVADSDREIANSIIRFLSEPNMAAVLAREGHDLVQRRYSWEANFAGLEDWLALLASLPCRIARRENSFSLDMVEQVA